MNTKDLTGGKAGGKYEKRPPPCLSCGAAAWWNGSRIVGGVQQGPKGEAEHVAGQVRRRACCPCPSCPVGSWTVYEADSYPHRTFGLEVAVSAVVEVVRAGATLTAAAARHLCSRDSVRRWIRWVEGLADPLELERLCMRIDPAGLPAAGARADRAPVAQRVLQLLERLADLLAAGGVPLPHHGAGLVRVLVDRLARFGEVLWLTKSSPPLRADLGRLGV